MMDDILSSSSTEYSSSSTSAKPYITKTTANKQKLILFIEGFNFQFKSLNKNKTEILASGW